MDFFKKVGNWWNHLSSTTRHIVSLFIVTRILFTLLGVIALKIIAPYHPSPDTLQHWPYSHIIFLKIWMEWDSGWYINIAQQGYSLAYHLQTVQSNVAFFPLYPLLMRLCGDIFFLGNYGFAGFIISNVSIVLALLVFVKLIEIDYGQKIAERAALYLLLFPTGFILSGVFTESLFLLLSVSSFYYARKDSWWLAGLCGFFAALTRPTGIFLVVPLGLIYIKNKKKINNFFPSIVSLLLIPLGTLTFFSFFYYKFHDFLSYFKAEHSGWQHTLSNPLRVIIEACINPYIQVAIQGYALIVCFLLLLIMMKKIRIEYILFTFLLMISAPLAGTVMSSLRYLSVCFALPLALALLAKDEEYDYVIAISLAVLQGLLFVLWVNGFWLTI